MDHDQMERGSDMDQDQVEIPECVLCGTRKGSYKFYHDAKDEDLYLCVDCLKDAMRSLTSDQLESMTTAQLRRHMEVRDELAATYKDSFAATKTFRVGKKRTVPIIEVDERRGLWALPKAPMPLAQPIRSIADVEVSLGSDDLGESGEALDELIEGAQAKEYLVPFLSILLKKLYRSKHIDLAPIPEGQLVSQLSLVLTLDDRASGLGRVEVDLLPFWMSLPSRVNAGYDCAYEFIMFLRQLANAAYQKEQVSGKGLCLACSDRLSTLATSGQISRDEAETIRYYLERVEQPDTSEGPGSAYRLVRSVVDAVCEHLVYGEKAPDLKTQHTVAAEAFLGAFYRYAPGLSVSDVVYLVDETQILSGKGGLLFAQDCFAVDDFGPNPEESAGPSQPIAYDDLLCVGKGTDKGQLVLVYRDGRRHEVNGGKYAHVIFAAVNCILLLRLEGACSPSAGQAHPEAMP